MAGGRGGTMDAVCCWNRARVFDKINLAENNAMIYRFRNGSILMHIFKSNPEEI